MRAIFIPLFLVVYTVIAQAVLSPTTTDSDSKKTQKKTLTALRAPR